MSTRQTSSHSDYDYSQIHDSKIPRIEAWVMIVLILILTCGGFLLFDLQ
jgi:hypothetical protein